VLVVAVVAFSQAELWVAVGLVAVAQEEVVVAQLG
jgi:hypothetical protein